MLKMLIVGIGSISKYTHLWVVVHFRLKDKTVFYWWELNHIYISALNSTKQTSNWSQLNHCWCVLIM